MSYKLVKNPITGATNEVVKRITDSAFIPFDENNTDYIKYKEWLAEGNTPEAADQTVYKLTTHT